MKLIIGIFSLAILLSGCANQHFDDTQYTSLSTASVTKPTKRPQATTSKPETQQKPAKRLADQTPTRKAKKHRMAAAEKRLVAAPAPKPAPKPSTPPAGAAASCQQQLGKLPADADRRQATIGVQCYFISRGEYLTVSGKAKSL